MKQKLFLLTMTLLALASPIFAQGDQAGGGSKVHLGAAYIAMGIAAGLCGIGQGRATASAAEAMARNPAAIAAIRVALILGLVLIESLALYTLVITFVVKIASRKLLFSRRMKLQGIFPALTSSFDHTGKLYKAKVLHNIDKLNSVALAGYVAGGSTGETPLLSSEERLQMMAWVKAASAPGKLLIAGVGAESVHETVRMAQCAADIGFDAALVLTPFYYRNQMHRPETQALFFRAVADRSKLPVILYNIPQVTGYALPVETIAQLAEHPNIIGMKDSSGNLEKMGEALRAVRPGFEILTGASGSLWDALQLGASGAILALANAVPYACITIWEAFRKREREAGLDWQSRLAVPSKLIAGQYGIPGLKHAMDLNGYYGGPPRLPFLPPSESAKLDIEQAFAELKG